MKNLFSLSVALLVGIAASASAQITPYATRTLYNAATTNNTVLPFTGQQQALAPSISIGGVTFSGVGSIAGSPVQVEIIDGTNVGLPGNDILTTNNAAFLQDSIRIALPLGTTGFATDFKAATNSAIAPPETFQFTLFSGVTNLGSFLAPSVTGNALSFVGFTSASTPITAVQIQATGAIGSPTAVLDNVTFAAVPEPATTTLFLAAGLVGASGYLFRRRSSRA